MITKEIEFNNFLHWQGFRNEILLNHGVQAFSLAQVGLVEDGISLLVVERLRLPLTISVGQII